MVKVKDFGICNFRLARQVMESGKCACKPKEECPCPEWLNDGKCSCGVFWDKEGGFEFTKSQREIAMDIIEWLESKIEDSVKIKKTDKQSEGKKRTKKERVREIRPEDLMAIRTCPRQMNKTETFPACFEGTGEPDCERCTKGQ